MTNRLAVVGVAMVWCVPSLAGAVVQPESDTELETSHRLLEYRTTTTRRFVDDAGRALIAEWDERTETPLRIYGRPIPLVDADAPQSRVVEGARRYLQTLSPLAGVPAAQLPLASANRVGNVWYLRFDRVTAEGLPVEGAAAEVRIRDGAITLVKLDTHPDANGVTGPVSVDAAAARYLALADFESASVASGPTLVVLPVARPDRFDYRLAWRVVVDTQDPVGRWLTHIDAANGELLRRENQIAFFSAEVQGEVEPRTIGDTMEAQPMPYLSVEMDGETVNASGGGKLEVQTAGDATAALYGIYTNVNNSAGSDGEGVFGLSESDPSILLTDQMASQAEIAAYRHTETVKDWWRQAAPDLDWVNQQLTVNVNLSGSCNAYWNGSTTNFYRAGGGCNNVARIGDVVYHEFGHGFHQNILESGSINGSIGEGSADYIAASITQDPIMAPGFFTDGGHIRNADNDKVYPDDLQGEVHADGEIWVGTMWDLMSVLQNRYGEEKGRQRADRIFADILRSGPGFGDLYAEALLADDNDNDLGNGTPHACEIDEVFSQRGLSSTGDPGTPSFIAIDHTGVISPAAADAATELTIGIDTGVSPCAVDEPDTLTVWWRNDDGAFNELSVDPAETVTQLPAQPDGTVVEYYVEATAGDVTSSNPPVVPSNVHRFYVGDLDVVFDDDFETDSGWTHGADAGSDDWQRGTPRGRVEDPAAAFSGTQAWGNDLGWNGTNGAYEANVTSWLESPEIDCTDCEGARLQFRRWLSLDDAVARILVNDTVVWDSQNRFDSHWEFVDVDISDVADGQVVKLRFEIESGDTGGHGGWTLDDVSVVMPAKVTEDPGDDPGDDPTDDPGTGAEPKDGAGCSCDLQPVERTPWSQALLAALLLLVGGAGVIFRRRTA